MKYESILNAWGRNKVPNGERWEVFGRQKTGDWSTHILTSDAPGFQFEVWYDMFGGPSTEEALKCNDNDQPKSSNKWEIPIAKVNI